MSDQSVDPKVLTALYSEYLNRSIQQAEEIARLRVRVSELEGAAAPAGDPAEGDA